MFNNKENIENTELTATDINVKPSEETKIATEDIKNLQEKETKITIRNIEHQQENNKIKYLALFNKKLCLEIFQILYKSVLQYSFAFYGAILLVETVVFGIFTAIIYYCNLLTINKAIDIINIIKIFNIIGFVSFIIGTMHWFLNTLFNQGPDIIDKILNKIYKYTNTQKKI